MRASALVLARSAAAAELRPLLGAGAHRALVRALRELAHGWAQTVAPGRATVVEDPDDARAIIEQCLRRHRGPLLVAGVTAPRLGPVHAAAALADLAAGADASFGPGMDGGWYLVALASPRAELLELAGAALDGPDVMARTLEVARAARLDIGLLRMERRLVSPRDAHALAVDPLTPAPIRRLLAALPPC